MTSHYQRGRQRRWYVTLLDRGVEVTVEVPGATATAAKRAAKALHPSGHTTHVEPVRGS